MSEHITIGSILHITNPSWPRTRQRAVIVAVVRLKGDRQAVLLRLLPDEEEGVGKDAQKGRL